MDNKKEKRLSSAAYYFIVAAIILLLLALLIFIFGKWRSNDVEVSGGGKTIGLKCTDTKLLHPALRDRTPISHTNTIMANFTNNDLSAITLYYVGVYSSPSEAIQAEAYAQADYGLILAKEYNVGVDFSHSFMINGEKVSMTITSENGSVDAVTAPYFLLEQGKSFPKNLSEMKQRYEERDFSCEIAD